MIGKIATLLREKKVSSVELTKLYLKRIASENERLNAYVSVTEKEAIAQAEATDKRISDGDVVSVLDGIPCAVKDNISTKGILTSCCSKMLESYYPIYDATVWEKLKQNGAVLLGKTNMDEFAMGSSCETSCYGGAKNPHDISKVAGGSSGGSGCATAANLTPYSLGSDTGGSIRQPASFCGCVGFKPTYGTVSRYGLIAYASSFDQIGPITGCVEDAAIVFDAISGKDDKDESCVGAKEKTAKLLEKRDGNFTIGVVEEYFNGASDDVKSAVKKAITEYENAGANVVTLSIPSLKAAVASYYILACAEASSNLGRYDGIRYGLRANDYSSVHDMVCRSRSEGFGMEVKRRILLGTYVLCSGYYDAYYQKAKLLQAKLRKEFEEAFSSCDILITPTVPTTAFPEGFTEQDPIKVYQTDLCTAPVNIAGLPALSIPCGKDSNGLPIGLQIIGCRFADATVLQAGYHFEKITDGRYIQKREEGLI